MTTDRRFARLAAPTGDVGFHPIERPESFFRLLEEEFGAVPTENDGHQFMPLSRICSQAREHRVATVVIENLPNVGDLAEENEDLETKETWNGNHVAKRISFFRSHLEKTTDLDSANSDEFIGYFIWKEDYRKGTSKKAMRRVYEAVIPTVPAPWRCIRPGKAWEVSVGGKSFSVNGHLFCQQNSVTNVCAHAAARSVASLYHPAGDMTFREMNALMDQGDKEKKGIADISDGLSISNIVRILESAGAECSVYECHDLVESPLFVSYQRWLYECIESGYPGILVFGDSAGRSAEKPFLHSVPVFGHTFNQDMWLPRAETSHFSKAHTLGFIPSDFWMGSFIGHDDNFGPNYSIPRHYFRSMRPAENDHPQYPSVEGVACVVGTRPKRVKMRGMEAEIASMAILKEIQHRKLRTRREPAWLKRVSDHIKRNHLVLRAIHVSKERYLEHLRSIKGWDTLAERLDPRWVDDLGLMDANEFWMVEVSVPELFPTNKRKLGEVLLRSDSAGTQLQNENLWGIFIGARLPGGWWRSAKGGNDAFPKLEEVPLTIVSHSSLYGCEDT